MIKDSQSRGFKGVWIPAEIWDDDRLTWFEKCLWAEVYSLSCKERPCTWTNQMLADASRTTPQTIVNALSKLRSVGLIKDVPEQTVRTIVAVYEPYEKAILEQAVGKPRGLGGQTQGFRGVNPGVKANAPPNINKIPVEIPYRNPPLKSPVLEGVGLPPTESAGNGSAGSLRPKPIWSDDVVAADGSGATWLSLQLTTLFSRRSDQPWSPWDRANIQRIVSTPTWQEEFKVISDYIKRRSAKGLKVVQSAERCLSDWVRIYQQAKNDKPKKKYSSGI